jgi:hypothetical protein
MKEDQDVEVEAEIMIVEGMTIEEKEIQDGVIEIVAEVETDLGIKIKGGVKTGLKPVMMIRNREKRRREKREV